MKQGQSHKLVSRTNLYQCNSLPLSVLLEDTAHYASLLLASAEGFGLQPRDLLALWAKKDLIMLVWPILDHFWCPVVTLVTFISTLSNFLNLKRMTPPPKKKYPLKTLKIQHLSKKIPKFW